MGFITELWIPILVSAVAAWIVQAIVWTVMPHRKKEWRKVGDDDAFKAAIRGFNLEPGYYMFPWCDDPSKAKDAEFHKKMNEPPLGTLHLWAGRRSMGACMAWSFVFNLAASVSVAYLAWEALERPGVDYLKVFQITGAAAFLAYTFALIPGGIWFGKPIKSMAYDVADGLAVALLTGGIFGWLWPAAQAATDAVPGAAPSP
ncbi:MAG: hypothetical protein D6693_07735 [Planctomycetota bacterium]|nr:MAG: hypothetical protein D6693_07735 [Planctomycetota bacterium]